MALQESLKEIKYAWSNYYIQGFLAIHLIAGAYFWQREMEAGETVIFFDSYLQFVSLASPLLFLALFLLRRRPVMFAHQYNVEHLFWWSFCDSVVGTSLILFWVITALLWEAVSILGVIMVYINILVYLMLLFTLLLLIYVFRKKPWQAALGTAVIHGALYGFTLVAPEAKLLGLNIFPHQVILDFPQVLNMHTGVWEWLTPVMVTGLIILALRNLTLSYIQS